MPLDLNSKKEPIDHTDKQYEDVLQDLQGNILKSHGKEESVHIFLTFSDPSKEPQKTIALKQLIAQFATQDITSAKKQLDDADAWRESKIDGGIFVHFSLSSSGYEKLGFSKEIQPKGANLQNRLEATPQELKNDYAQVFQLGMKRRQYALLDSPFSAWETAYQSDIDALIIIAADKLTDVKNKELEITDKLRGIATVATVERATKIRRQFNNQKEDPVVEHFCFTDGITEPRFTKQDLKRKEGETAKRLFSAPPNLVLVPDPLGTPNVSFGSFLIFRKLEQNVQGFKKAELELSAVSGQSLPGQSNPVIQEVPQPPKNWLKERDRQTVKADVKFANFVKLKGGEYFFSPSISFLKNLPNLPQNFPTPSIE
jgi:deferrochelatase/peroxidase EfeB